MALQFEIKPYVLQFKFDAGTSRGVLKQKTSYLLKIWEKGNPDTFGLGEAGPLPGLSIDDIDDFETVFSSEVQKLGPLDLPSTDTEIYALCASIPKHFPSMRFALEMALLDLLGGGNRILMKSAFTEGKQEIPINGLIWMGYTDFMLEQINAKVEEGYDCIKIKIGALNFEKELDVITYMRQKFYKQELKIRLDANGAFGKKEVFEKLKALEPLGIHSLEQPIKPKQAKLMRQLCKEQSIPLALDEELIGVYGEDKVALLEKIAPQYIILKPTLLGGIQETKEWIALAESKNIGWWMTSALESNIGLNAVSQLTATYAIETHQGLGTGQLYTNNFASPLTIEKGHLRFAVGAPWDIQY